MSSVPPLLSAPGAGKPTRSASGVAAKPTRGFQVFRIDGYSWTKALPGGQSITSEQFIIGDRSWQIDYYPNGTDGSSDNDSAAGSIALYLRLQNTYYPQNTYNRQNTYREQRVRAQYKFSLLDLAGNAAYELPAETGIFRQVRSTTGHSGDVGDLGCGYAGFITKEELEKRCDSLLKEDCLAIQCDVSVMEVTAMASVAPGPNIVMPDDNEYIHSCLSTQR